MSARRGSRLPLAELSLTAALAYLTLATSLAVGSTLNVLIEAPLSGLTIPEVGVAALGSLFAVPLLLVPALAH